MQGTFGVIQGTFGVIQGTFGVIQGTFGVTQGTFCVIQGTFDVIQGTFCVIQGTFILVGRFVHGDPHAGNVHCRPLPGGAGETPQIIILDHGLYHKIDASLRRDFCELISSCIIGRRYKIIHSFINIQLSLLINLIYEVVFIINI
jgi:hypothetical protein